MVIIFHWNLTRKIKIIDAILSMVENNLSYKINKNTLSARACGIAAV